MNHSLDFNDVLTPMSYCRADDSPVVALREIYPFESINITNQYAYDSIILHLSKIGFSELLPILLRWLCNTSLDEDGYPIGASSNLMDSFRFIVENDNDWDRTVRPAIVSLDARMRELSKELTQNILELEILDKADQSCFQKVLKELA